MSEPREVQLEEARRWLREAEEELAWARMGGEHEELIPRVGCFLAHLAAEKALKAILIANGTDFAKVHSLVELQSDLPENVAADIDRDVLTDLDPWAIGGRYPADLPDPGSSLADRLVNDAADIVARSRVALESMARPTSEED